MSTKAFSCNPVISFIASQPPPCSSIGCTTCGGMGSFARRMKNEFQNVDDVLHAFIEIEEHEMRWRAQKPSATFLEENVAWENYTSS